MQAVHSDSEVQAADSGSEVWDARGVALLMPADSSPEVALILQVDDVPAGLVLEIFGSSQLYVRMRNGPLAFGLAEPFRQRESSHPLERGPAVITRHDHYAARFEGSATMFGAQDTVVVIPYASPGTPHPRVSIPMMSIKHPRRAIFERGDHIERDGWTYRFVDEIELETGFVCPVCGKFCEQQEPHGASHGVPGHFVAGTAPGRASDDIFDFGRHYRGAR
jgi:hypothetical protein